MAVSRPVTESPVYTTATTQSGLAIAVMAPAAALLLLSELSFHYLRNHQDDRIDSRDYGALLLFFELATVGPLIALLFAVASGITSVVSLVSHFRERGNQTSEIALPELRPSEQQPLIVPVTSNRDSRRAHAKLAAAFLLFALVSLGVGGGLSALELHDQLNPESGDQRLWGRLSATAWMQVTRVALGVFASVSLFESVAASIFGVFHTRQAIAAGRESAVENTNSVAMRLSSSTNT